MAKRIGSLGRLLRRHQGEGGVGEEGSLSVRRYKDRPEPLGIIVMEMTGGRTLSTGIPVWKAIPAVLVGFCLQAAVAWNTSVNVQGSGFTLSLCLERRRLPPLPMRPGHPHALSPARQDARATHAHAAAVLSLPLVYPALPSSALLCPAVLLLVSLPPVRWAAGAGSYTVPDCIAVGCHRVARLRR